MDYTNLKEDTNIARLAGKIVSEVLVSHQIEGEKFFDFKVEVARLSSVADVIPVTVSERTLLKTTLKQGDFVSLAGEYRSYNKMFEDKSKLILHFFAKSLNILKDNFEYLNEIKLVGYVCKEPIYRKTPFEREICDVLLAVNRASYHKSDYIPCILWGRNARFMANQTTGCKVELTGRIQSREYKKDCGEGNFVSMTAYEVSCQSIAILGNVANMPVERNANSEKILVND